MNEKTRSPTVVPCPRCGASVAWTPENRYRPFCSERCRQIDLGAWAAGEYRVPAVEDPEQPDSQPAPGQDA
jgi:endogenous inhibitor of DNA gyrase (YacG/DUF329 family)